ncbi:sigma-70 family RNA polymerase sigma factor [Streptomyces sp. NPDC057909]|uniref:sigma-70 family RNA polymerase sigma factor n=1 Tax=Streptomyces sp. NPDC057909 TaxID=3346277 RepID=UPI0036E3D966
MTPEQSRRLGALFEQYGHLLISYAQRRLTGYGWGYAAAESLAEDIAQEAWVEVSRTGAKDLLRPEPLSANETRAILFARVKTQIRNHFKRSRSHERPVDWSDPVTSNALCPLMVDQCPLAEPSETLLEQIATLPEREREALLLQLDGCPNQVLGERLGCSMSTGRRLVETALLRLQLCHSEVAKAPAGPESLPSGQREALAKLDDKQREALLRIDDLPRQVLLLHLTEELDSVAICTRLGVDRLSVRVPYACVTSLKASEKVAARGIFREKGAASRALLETLRVEVEALQPGGRVPPERILTARFRCSGKTVRAAMKRLCAEGVVTSRGSQGMFRSTDVPAMAVAA